MNQILTVSQINGYLKGLLDEDVQLKSIYIRGEIPILPTICGRGIFILP